MHIFNFRLSKTVTFWHLSLRKLLLPEYYLLYLSLCLWLWTCCWLWPLVGDGKQFIWSMSWQPLWHCLISFFMPNSLLNSSTVMETIFLHGLQQVRINSWNHMRIKIQILFRKESFRKSRTYITFKNFKKLVFYLYLPT